jgi:hypothetical protein
VQASLNLFFRHAKDILNYIKVKENKNEHSLEWKEIDSLDFIMVVIILGLSHNGTIDIVHQRWSLIG